MNRFHMSYNTAFIFLSFIIGGIFASTAQEQYSGQIGIENFAVAKESGVVRISMDLNLEQLKLDRNHLLIITPVLKSDDDGETEELQSVAVIGKLRNRILRRPFQWKGKPDMDFLPDNMIVREDNTSQSIHYETEFPYDEWQRKAKLILKNEYIGCADCGGLLPDRVVGERILPDRFIPDYHVEFITPEVEKVKQRSESYSAHLNYPVGRWDLVPDLGDNMEELAKVDKIIRELQQNNDLTITDFTITGYASPEGKSDQNLLLSRRRAETFAGFMEKKYGYGHDRFSVKWSGEDWPGLRKSIAASSLPRKEELLKIIDTESIADNRDARIIALDNGSTYRQLLDEFYPPLRRNEYNISFVSRPFSVSEAAEVLKRNPKLLSLNEMFLVAESYPVDSPQYKEIFEIAAATFPDSEVANYNAAVSAYRSGDDVKALRLSQKAGEQAGTLNLIGVILAKQGNSDKALDYLSRAAETGMDEAKHNLKQLKQYIENSK